MFERVIARHAILRDNLTLFGYDLVFRLPCDSRAPEWTFLFCLLRHNRHPEPTMPSNHSSQR
jgi:hypothetical protein